MYRLIHTSDWHLGQHFKGQTREREHQQLIGWLLQQVQAHQVDAVLIVGDLFDTVSPPSYARQQYHDLIDRLKQAGCELIILGGNHDSVAVLSELKPLAAHINMRVLPSLSTMTLAEGTIVLHDRQGQPAAVLCAVPFIRPRDVLTAQQDIQASDKQAAMLSGISQHYQQVYTAGRQLAAGHGDIPVIGTGHLTTVRASRSESEREIYIGTLEAVPLKAFPEFDYLALGHIHQPQVIREQPPIYYSGSPIALSFDERVQQKSVQLISIDQGQLAMQALPIPVFQTLQTIRGNREQIVAEVTSLVAQFPEPPGVWLDVQVETTEAAQLLLEQLHQLIAGSGVRILQFRRMAGTTASITAGSHSQLNLSELTHEQVFSQRLEQSDMDDLTCKALTELYRQVSDELLAEQDA